MSDTFYNALENALMQRKAEKHGPEIRFLCPAHDDHTPSADYNTVKHSWICRSCGAKGGAFELADLVNVPRPVRSSGSAIQEIYSYTDEQGRELFQVVRGLKDGKKTFSQRHYNPAHPKAKTDGWAWTLEGVERVPYRLPNVLEAVKQGQTIFVTEGEKDVATLEGWGLVATCNPGGAGKWTSQFSKFLRGADVVIVPDNDSAGRDHAQQVLKSLQGLAQRVRVLELPGLPDKGDVSDWKAAGGTLEAFKRLLETAQADTLPAKVAAASLKTESIAALMNRTFPEPRFLLAGLIPESGLVVLAGAQKLGKSWFALQLSLAVALSGKFLGHDLDGGDVLYLALEDNPRRMQSRVKKLLELDKDIDSEALERFDYLHEIHPLDLGGIENLRTWLEQHPNARLVVIDVLKRALSGKLDFNDYGQVTAALSPLQRLSHEFNVPILVVTHTRKGHGEGGDPFDRVLGSTAIASVADATLVLVRDRMQNTATLAATGRDIEERELAVVRDPLTALWSINGDGNPRNVALTPLHHRVLTAVEGGFDTNAKLCERLNKSKGEVGNLLKVLVDRGHLEREAGIYRRVGSYRSQVDGEDLRTIESTARTIEKGTVLNGSQRSYPLENVEPTEPQLALEWRGSQSVENVKNSSEPQEKTGVAQDESGSQPSAPRLRTLKNAPDLGAAEPVLEL